MGKTLLVRLAAGAAGGTLALAAAAPALAHDTPASGFNAVLHAPHHNVVVDSNQFPQLCGDVKDQSPGLIGDGVDVWVFNIPSGTFDEEADPIASIQFDTGTITIPGDADFVIGPPANPHNLAVAVPAGSTLLDGDFNVSDSKKDVVVTHTCPGDENGETPPPGNGKTPPPGNGETPPPGGENGEGGENGDDDEGELPVTGLQVGGLLALGAGLLAGGVALLAIRRRNGLADLADG